MNIQIVIGLQVVTLLLIILMIVGVFKAGFTGTVRSEPQAINLGASHMSRRSDGVYEYERPMSFLGAPMGGEAPTFYDIGDVSAARAAVGGTMGAAQRRGINTASSGAGFADLDDLLVNSSR
jgi:hypothetical protein